MRKKKFLFCLFLLSFSVVHAQRLDTLSADAKQQYLMYMKQRSANNTFGWILLGTGAAIFGTTFLVNSANGWNGPTKGEGLFEAGMATAALSPVFFILAGVNKRKAQVILKGERLTSAITINKTCYPAISLRIILP